MRCASGALGCNAAEPQMPGSEFLGLHETVGGRFGEAKPQVRFALVAGIVGVDLLPCRIRGIQFCMGIGFSIGMFPPEKSGLPYLFRTYKKKAPGVSAKCLIFKQKNW